MFMLRVMMYDDSYELFWTRISAVRFVSREVWSDKGLLFDKSFIPIFNQCVVVITEHLNSTHFQYQ